MFQVTLEQFASVSKAHFYTSDDSPQVAHLHNAQ